MVQADEYIDIQYNIEYLPFKNFISERHTMDSLSDRTTGTKKMF